VPVAVDEQRTIRVRGTVQGVGFRPFVYRTAVQLGLRGFVRNDEHGVLVVAAGRSSALDELCRRLTTDAPPLARVDQVEISADVDPATGALPGDEVAGDGFHIAASDHVGDAAVPVPADSATCAACLAEIRDPANRRYRYPFTNCTDCGPRYTIVLAVPYDRPATTMAGFTMCSACQAEYDDPTDRRFHAQPNACPRCGPRLVLRSPDGQPIAEGDAALAATVARLRDGQIVAVKGLGGYHLAVDATSTDAVAELRRRKARDDKPFAVMVADLGSAERLVVLGEAAREALRSPRRPIVLAPRRDGEALDQTGIAPDVAPGLRELGLMLPYTPLHHLLLDGVGRPLVMTSGNASDDPIAHLDDDALERLGPMVDALLTHDRPIHVRCDDSVVRAASHGVQVLRRSRGYAPEPLALPGGAVARHQVLALGAELKATVAVAKGRTVVASHHLGDLEHLGTFLAFEQAVEHLPRLSGVHPEVVACDLHPEYLSTKHAERLAGDLGARVLQVQHHHAHVAACLVDAGEPGPVVALAFDGFGYGPDGSLWGGELLVADLTGYRRVGHLLTVPVPGAGAAVAEPWRMTVAWLDAAGGDALVARHASRLDRRWAAVLDLGRRAHSLRTSSVGRLFDAVAALLDVRRRVTYEGQAAIELQALAARAEPTATSRYPCPVLDGDGGTVLDARPMVAAICDDLDRGVPEATMAADFHQSLAAAAAQWAAAAADRAGLAHVALTGGVFQNDLLATKLADALAAHGLRVLRHRRVPPNDGGISIGQAAIAARTD